MITNSHYIDWERCKEMTEIETLPGDCLMDEVILDYNNEWHYEGKGNTKKVTSVLKTYSNKICVNANAEIILGWSIEKAITKKVNKYTNTKINYE